MNADRVNATRFRRLLRWYPRAWRERDGDALLGTMLDAAEAAGRTVPTFRERMSAAAHGLGERLDARTALVAAIAGTIVVAIGSITMYASFGGDPALVALRVASAWLGPALLAVSLSASARLGGLVGGPRSVAAVGLAAPALVFAALAAAGWGNAFAAADAGLPPTGLGAVWPSLFLAGWVLGAATLGLLLDAMLERILPRPASLSIAALCGIVGAPVLGLGLLSPATGMALAVAATLAAVFVPRRVAAGPRHPARHIPAARAGTPVPTRAHAPGRTADAASVRRARGLARTLAWTASACGAAGVLLALTGERWGLGADGTAAMARGIGVCLVGAVPLLAAIGVRSAARSRRHPLIVWAPLALFALAAAATAVAYLHAPDSEAMTPGLYTAAGLTGAGLASLLAPRLPGAPAVRTTAALAIGAGYAATLGFALAPALAILSPAASIAVAIALSVPGRPRSADGPARAAAVPE